MNGFKRMGSSEERALQRFEKSLGKILRDANLKRAIERYRRSLQNIKAHNEALRAKNKTKNRFHGKVFYNNSLAYTYDSVHKKYIRSPDLDGHKVKKK